MDIYNFISLIGMVVLIGFGWLCSTNRREINWHIIIWGVGLQMLFAWFLFVFPAGTNVFLFMNDFIVQILDAAMAGSRFLFGPLALAPGMTGASGEGSIGFILAFQVFPVIIFFSSLMSILYFFNIIPRIVRFFAFLFTRLMKVSGAESLCAASNIFVGVESALTVKPFLKKMTLSELCTVLTAGMATVSSSVMALYVFTLKGVFPMIAGHLIAASFLSAPAALAMSKVLWPETETPATLGENVRFHVQGEDNLFEAIINGAHAGVKLIVGIAALLIAVLGLVALFDKGLLFFGDLINQAAGIQFDWSLKGIMGVIFYPFTAVLGVPVSDIGILSKIIGERLIMTEVASYQDLALAISQGTIQNTRSIVIATYALCGFAHLASLAIFIGGISAIVPEQTRQLSKVGLRALMAANLACLLTACVAGLFFVAK